MKLIYISTDLNVNSSGGLVVKNELEAMRLISNEIITIGMEIHPTSYNLPDIPLFIDYLALEKLSKINLDNVKLVHMYGGCYTQTIKFLRSKGIKTSMTLMFHNRKTSIEEHEKYFGIYPYNYVKDDNLWNMYIGEIREVDTLIISGKAPEQLAINEGCKHTKIILLGCDIPAKTEPIPTNFDVGYLGAIGPDKGLIYLIKAWESLNYEDSTLIFAGSQSHQLKDFILNNTNTGKFHLMGYVNDPYMLYNQCSVYVQPSATEGFGLEVPEAMSYGRPVIVTDGAGAADCITDGVDGFIIPKMNINAISDKIDWLKNHPKELIKMGNNARENSKKYTWKNTQDNYINTWKRLLNEQ